MMENSFQMSVMLLTGEKCPKLYTRTTNAECLVRTCGT